MSISVPRQDLAPNRLVCLASSLRESYSDRSEIVVSVFSSLRAASHSIGALSGQEDTKENLDAFAQLHARYVFSAQRHEDYVETIPMHEPYTRREMKLYNTRIDLPTADIPPCHLQVNGRCLIALNDVAYPYEALKRGVVGLVTVRATIGRSGTISGIRIVKVQSATAHAKNLLEKAAVENLSSWRAEPGQRTESIRITYSFMIDDSLPNKGQTQVQWSLPSDVVVKGKPE